GAAVEAFGHYWREVGGGGGQLAQAEQSAEQVAEVLEGFAAVVVAVKAEVIVQLGILAGELAGTTTAAIFTAGAAEAAVPEEVVAGKLRLARIPPYELREATDL